MITKILNLLLLPLKIIKKLLNSIFKKEKKVKYSDYDYFIDCLDKTLERKVDFRAEFRTEQINFIINPLKPVRTPRKPKKEVKEENETKTTIEESISEEE